jgi:hypothetical protein
MTKLTEAELNLMRGINILVVISFVRLLARKGLISNDESSEVLEDIRQDMHSRLSSSESRRTLELCIAGWRNDLRQGTLQ